ncbi:MAG: hypothetical protein EXQ69_03725 [Acidimicrobiia bacterium]|nr:hypothetical protein [Acidimicrobiia bacterium]
MKTSARWVRYFPMSSIPPDSEITVHHMQPYQAVKTYRCPGCDHEIGVGIGHEVVVPLDATDLRRHWHTGCWQQEERRRKH